ncbi:unnamed protein product [Blepharisma stoltei]|uniref:Polyadenylate-binding protein n=1 Tax=Blepharisma stoltei TaxID=1481888 RepID=A0AAU9JCB4_9CILI|nr:unnamed protein product [Blepharisma stoltei]
MQPQSTDTQIYVGDLHPEVTESELYTLASLSGKVVYIRVLRNLQTKAALGFAFIQFADIASTIRAQEEMNGTSVRGKHIRVMKYSRERDPEANIFVKNFNEDVTTKTLEHHFRKFGPILSSKICYDDSGKSKRFGFVQFEKKEAAQAAIQAANGSDWNGATVQVEKYVPIGKRTYLSSQNLYVRGFGAEMTNEKLKEKFSQYGEVTSSAVIKSPDANGSEKYYGFVCFNNAENAKKAEALHGVQDEGFAWYVVPHMKRGARLAWLRSEYLKKQEDWKRRNIIIRNLPLSIDEEKLRKLCQDFGTIESIKIPKVKNIKYQNEAPIEETTNKGIGLVCFKTPAESAKAIQVLRTKTVEEKKLLVFPWKPREEIAKIVNMNRMKKIYSQMWEFGMMNPMMMGRGGHMKPMDRGQMHPAGRGRGQRPVVQGIPQPNLIPPVMVASQRPMPMALPITFNYQAYEAAQPDIKKRMLGEALYPQVLTNSNQKVAGKITGMLLEMDNVELLGLLSNPLGLKGKVVEAIEVLKKAWENDAESLKLIEGIA